MTQPKRFPRLEQTNFGLIAYSRNPLAPSGQPISSRPVGVILRAPPITPLPSVAESDSPDAWKHWHAALREQAKRGGI